MDLKKDSQKCSDKNYLFKISRFFQVNIFSLRFIKRTQNHTNADLISLHL